MQLVTESDSFNTGFNLYLQDDTENYFEKLVKYASDYSVYGEETKDKLEDLLNEISYICSDMEEDEDVDFIEANRREISKIMMNFNNYFSSFDPYQALKLFLSTDIRKLINDSRNYTESIKKDIVNKVDYIVNKNNIEYERKKDFNTTLKNIRLSMNDGREVVFLYETMNFKSFNYNKDDLLVKVVKYVDALKTEADIISRFDSDGRKYISSKMELANKDKSDQAAFFITANMCEVMLLNYSLLSIYSNKPESLRISETMYKSIYNEVAKVGVSRDDLVEIFTEGKIKFSNEEYDYISEYFINKLRYQKDNENITKQNLVLMLR